MGSDAMTHTEWYILCSYLTFLSVVGTAGNALVLIVFYRKKDKQVSTFFIIVLAIVDFTTCLILIPITMFMEFKDFKVSQDFLCKGYMMLNGGMIHFSALIMVAIALERYFCICYPFLRLLTLKRAKYVLGCLAFGATALGICIALTHGVFAEKIGNSTLHGVSNSTDTVSENATSFWFNGSSELFVREQTEKNSIHNSTFSFVSPTDLPYDNRSYNETSVNRELVNVGNCQENYLILSQEFQLHFQRLSNALYLVYLAIVIILYSLIYHSVMKRRARRQKQKSACLVQVRQAQEKAKMAERITNAINFDLEEKSAALAKETSDGEINQNKVVLDDDNGCGGGGGGCSGGGDGGGGGGGGHGVDNSATADGTCGQEQKLLNEEGKKADKSFDSDDNKHCLLNNNSRIDRLPTTTTAECDPGCQSTPNYTPLDRAAMTAIHNTVDRAVTTVVSSPSDAVPTPPASRQSMTLTFVTSSIRSKFTKSDPGQLQQQQQQQRVELQKALAQRRQRFSKSKKQMVDGTMLANMKTAAMLFVVTVIFFATFTPAFLSAIRLIDYKVYLFYLYFANNVANPIIYSFMNRNFRVDLKKLLCNKVD